MQFTKNGMTREFSMDIDVLLEMEDSDPTFNLINILDDIDTNFRFGTFIKIAKLVGSDYKTMVHEYGYDMTDIISIFVGCLEEEGFPSVAPGQE